MDLENFKYLWLTPKVLSFDKTQIIFGFVLTYSYLWLTPKVLSFDKTQIIFGFVLTYSYLCTRIK